MWRRCSRFSLGSCDLLILTRLGVSRIVHGAYCSQPIFLHKMPPHPQDDSMFPTIIPDSTEPRGCCVTPKIPRRSALKIPFSDAGPTPHVRLQYTRRSPVKQSATALKLALICCTVRRTTLHVLFLVRHTAAGMWSPL